MWLVLFLLFYLIERMNYHDTILKMFFEKLSANISKILFLVQKKFVQL